MRERPEFFVPFADGPEQAEKVWRSTRDYIVNQHGWQQVLGDRRIFRLGYMHDGKHMEAQVGVAHPYGKQIDWDAFEEVGDEQEVLVILEHEGGPFLVCTLDRGVKSGEPILVGTGEPYEVVYFAGYGPDD